MRGVDLLQRLQEAPGAELVLGAVGDEPGVHAVGGAVRDALLDRVPRELDLVVEGDALAVARRAAARVGGTLTLHERFGTATVQADGYTFDLAAARRERYAHPGALPEVELGATLDEDLARRDFTVNAIAVRLADGALTAFPGARDDLTAGLLRVLHARSFADDPTRMLRLARYAARLGFAPEPGTEALVDADLLADVSGDRAGSELRLALHEPLPAALLAIERHGLGRALLGDGFRVPADVVAAARRATPPGAHAELVALAACCTEIVPGALAARLDALGFRARERELVTAAAASAARLTAALAGARTDADLWRVLHREPAEAAALVAAAEGPAAEAARRWLAQVRGRRLAISGDDLVAAGLRGPAVGAALEAATLAMLDGGAPDREAQLAVALGR
jgi:tRNA nucleotidyltransferase (CCA-adding enzyme)